MNNCERIRERMNFVGISKTTSDNQVYFSNLENPRLEV